MKKLKLQHDKRFVWGPQGVWLDIGTWTWCLTWKGVQGAEPWCSTHGSCPRSLHGGNLGVMAASGKTDSPAKERKSYFSQYKLEILMGESSQRKTIHMWWVMSAAASDESLVSNSNSSLLIWTVCLQSKISKVQPNSLPISASSLNEHNIPIPLMSFQEHQAIAKEYIY